MSENKITMIPVDKLHPHPDNPRKNVGDVSELAESIKKNGVLQNLTVVPLGNTAEEYTVIIGHRRLAAAKTAGLEVLPCVIADMTPQEQFHTMLTENMQRTDLTPMEQAQGFQIMFDWGYSEKDIAEKTGFSETTVRHRLNMAKLSTKAIEKYEKNNGFQLSLSDYYALEKVPTLKEKNEILNIAGSSRDIQQRAAAAERNARRNKAAEKIIKLLKKSVSDIKQSPDNYRSYDGTWETLRSISLDKEVPDKISVDRAKKGDTLYYFKDYSEVIVYRKKKKEKKAETEYDRQEKERKKRRGQLASILKQMTARRRDFFLAIIDGKIDAIPDSETAEVKDEIWKVILAGGTYVTNHCVEKAITGKNYYDLSNEENEAASVKASGLSVLYQMLAVMLSALSDKQTFDWMLRYEKEKTDIFKKCYAILERYGWSFEDYEESILDGTHELYTKPAAESDTQD